MNVHLSVNELCEYQNARCNDKNLSFLICFIHCNIMQKRHLQEERVSELRTVFQFACILSVLPISALFNLDR